MNSSDIEHLSFSGGASCHLLRPVQDTQLGPALVVMLAAIAGVNDYVITRARNLCADGYTVAVLDYFGREGAVPDISTPQLIGEAVAALDDRRVLKDLEEILEWARTERKPTAPVDVAESLKAPLLCHYGDWDRLVNREEIDGFTDRLRAAQKPYELFTYGGAPHAFDEWFRPAVFRPAASSAAWQRTRTFLNWHLRGHIGAH